MGGEQICPRGIAVGKIHDLMPAQLPSMTLQQGRKTRCLPSAMGGMKDDFLRLKNHGSVKALVAEKRSVVEVGLRPGILTQSHVMKQLRGKQAIPSKSVKCLHPC